MHNHVAFILHKFLVECQVCNTRQFIKDSLYIVVYSVKTVKSVFYYDRDKTFSPRDYLTPRIITYLKNPLPPESHWIGDNRKRS